MNVTYRGGSVGALELPYGYSITQVMLPNAPKKLVFIPPFSSLRMYKSLNPQPWSRSTTAFIPYSRFFFFIFRGQVPHILYLPFLHCYLSLGQSESYVCYSIPTSTLFNSSCRSGDELNTKSFIALTFLALASSVNALPARQFLFLDLFVREGLC